MFPARPTAIVERRARPHGRKRSELHAAITSVLDTRKDAERTGDADRIAPLLTDDVAGIRRSFILAAS
jgi:hypothetical protein